MDGLNRGWDNRTGQRRIDDAGYFGKMAMRFDPDLDYFRMRATREKAAARNAGDMRVRRVHLEMAERYQALVRDAEARSPGRMRLVS